MADRQNRTAQKKADLIIGLVGNPNCGKTTLFNALTGSRLKTANWPGVTVERVEGELAYKGLGIRIVDLPGTYSLDSYTIEEQITRKYIDSGEADVIINVADASLLERSLYLTQQLLERKFPVILALNMIDVAKAQGIKIDEKCLSEMLGQIPVVSVSARKEKGLESLLSAAVSCPKRTINRTFSEESGYACIEKITETCFISKEKEKSATDIMDQYLTHRFWGIPIFLGIMMLIFFLTFSVGDFFKGYFESGLDEFSRIALSFLQSSHCEDWVISLVVDGIVAGVGGILTFLPNILILFTALAVLEDSGYMARAAYVMNEIMGLAGLSGRAFLPLLLGFGCTVPAVMASRVLESRKDRLRTILITPFMSCSARLPIYVLFSELFFGEHAMAAGFSMYVLGLAVGILVAYVLKLTDREKDGDMLLIELPEYKTPNAHTIYVYVSEKVKDYLSKAGTTIFIASIIMWLVMNLGVHGFTTDMDQSFGAAIGKLLVPVFTPIGLGYWQIILALISGIAAKEVVVSSCSVLFGIGNVTTEAGMGNLSALLGSMGFGALNAYVLMVFCLLYVPCMAAVATIKRETGSWRWTAAMAVFQLATAWTVSFVIFQIGSMIW